MSDIINFYHGNPSSSNHVLEEIWNYTLKELEMNHDYIQWMFPLNEASKCQPNSPVLTDEDIAKFRVSRKLKLKLLRSVRVFMNFLRETIDTWMVCFDHNHLRITRMLRCLVIMGLEYEAYARLQEIRMMIVEAQEFNCPSPIAHKYWAEALLVD